MNKTLCIGGAFFFLAQLAQAEVILSDSFNYTNGPLITVSDDKWRHHNGATKWTDIEKFGVSEHSVRSLGGGYELRRAVGIRLMNPKKTLHLNRAGVCPQKRIRNGFDAVLFSSYGRGCTELAQYLNEQRERWVEQV